MADLLYPFVMHPNAYMAHDVSLFFFCDQALLSLVVVAVVFAYTSPFMLVPFFTLITDIDNTRNHLLWSKLSRL